MEPFENIGNGTVTADTTIYDDTTNDYTLTINEVGSNTEVRYGTNAQVTNGGAGALTSEGATVGEFTTEVIFEVDASMVNVNTNRLILSFDYYDNVDEDDTVDKIYAREDNTASWVEIYDRSAGTEQAWVEIENLDVASLLVAAGQTGLMGSTFQLKFSHNDQDEWSTDGFGLDNVVLQYTATQTGCGNGILDGTQSTCV
jgi:hypothetical protein